MLIFITHYDIFNHICIDENISKHKVITSCEEAENEKKEPVLGDDSEQTGSVH